MAVEAFAAFSGSTPDETAKLTYRDNHSERSGSLCPKLRCAGETLHDTIGLIQPESVPKSRSTVSAEYLQTQTAGQSVIQSLNLVPGVNFTNSDPYGSSGDSAHAASVRGRERPRRRAEPVKFEQL
jgi:hypothetical protein